MKGCTYPKCDCPVEFGSGTATATTCPKLRASTRQVKEFYFVLAVDDVKPGAADASITDAKTAADVLGLDVQSMLHAIECDGRCDTDDFVVVPVQP